MAVLLPTLALTVVAAGRSTWSPCGWSVLSTLTPIAERRRGHRFGVTAAWYVLGAGLGGLGLGLLMAGVALLHPPLWLAALACAVAAGHDAPVGPALPLLRRQVNEDWLEAYRPWAYAVGFGVQIGLGLATFITTAAVLALVVVGALGGPVMALSMGVGFGLLRGLAVLLTAGCRTPARLAAFHRRFAAAAPASRWVTLGVTLAVGVLLAPAVALSAAAVLGIALVAPRLRSLTPVS